MADPLSIAASVAGLIALSGSLYKIIRDFVEQATNPPQSIHSLLLGVSEMRLVLSAVSDLIDNFLKYPPRRRALVQLDHLIICLTQAVLSFSELEQFVDLLVANVQRSLWQRWKINNQNDRISRFTAKMQEHKTSISLVLNILQCESDTDAQQYRLSLHEMMKRIIDENKELRIRIDQLGSFVTSRAHSMTTTSRPSLALPSAPSIAEGTIREEDDGTSTIIDESKSKPESKPMSMHRCANNHPSHQHDASWPLPVTPISGSRYSMSEPDINRPFESELAQSWVYTRITRTKCDISFTTSQPLSGAWSMLSGLSLGQISNISIIALPITLDDVPNNCWYKGAAHVDPSPVDLKATRCCTNMVRVAILGECEVGKSTLITTFCYGGSHQVERYTTLGTSYYTSTVVDGVECGLTITDTPGLGTSDYAIVMNNAIENAEAFILAYSMTDFHSFSQLRSLYNIIVRAKHWPDTQRQPIVIVATKTDLKNLRAIPHQSRHSLAEELGCVHFDCSIESEHSFTEPFEELVRCSLFGKPALKPEGRRLRETVGAILGV